MAKPRILVVEDEELIAFTLRETLNALGYDALDPVATGEAALRRITETRPDAVLMDITLQGPMDGIETAARIPPEHHLPVIYLTACSDEPMLRRASATHPDGYLVKPFGERELHATLQMTLARRHAQAAARAAEARLRQAQRMEAIARVAGGVAHDVNALLATLFTELEELSDTATGDPVAAKRLRHVTNAAVREERVIQRLLTFSQRKPLAPLPTAVNRFIWNMIDPLYQTVGDSVRIQPHLPRNLWRVRIDGDEFETALLNIADNARDAMPAGGTLILRGENVILGRARPENGGGGTAGTDEAGIPADVPPGRYVRLSLTDTGAGMTEAAAKSAFEPFFTTKSPGAGRGLGLSHAFGFVRQAGGCIDIDSRPGCGTTVRLHLPALGEETSG